MARGHQTAAGRECAVRMSAYAQVVSRSHQRSMRGISSWGEIPSTYFAKVSPLNPTQGEAATLLHTTEQEDANLWFKGTDIQITAISYSRKYKRTCH